MGVCAALSRGGALQRVELAQRGDQFLALRGDSANAIGDCPSTRAVTRKWARRDARPHSEIKPPSRHSCDQQWVDRGDQGCLGRKQ